jgi:succinate dehydrogenase cytochrome b556 subunit
MTMLNATLEGGLRYRGREGQWAYVFNRVSGLATLLFLTLHILDTATVYFIPQGYETFVDIYRSTPVMISEIMLVGAVLYHGLNGYRVIYFDLKPDRWNAHNSARWFWGVCAGAFLLWLPAAFFMGRSAYLNNICRCPPTGEPMVDLPAWANLGIWLLLGTAAVIFLRVVTLGWPAGGLRRNFEAWTWLFMRWSGILLVPLVWIHVAISDVLVGVHAIDLDYVAMRWAILGWRVFDGFLLAFTFAHGLNGLRGVITDYVHSPAWRRRLNWAMLAVWVVWMILGMGAIVGGVRLE